MESVRGANERADFVGEDQRGIHLDVDGVSGHVRAAVHDIGYPCLISQSAR